MDRLHAPAQALQAADRDKVLCLQQHPFVQEIASLALKYGVWESNQAGSVSRLCSHTAAL